ncbi:MAG TPA: DUF3800 domain-containing protein [Nitrosopumilaceae archaeon]|nr:DUF3800 domain-containing protein [Nitrosopumilaceae archaeon]
MPDVSVFVDESGDLGFKQKSSEFFVISYIIMINDVPMFLRNKCRRLLMNINTQNRKKRKISEFKFSEDTPKTRNKFLKLIATFDISIGIAVISKDSVKSNIRNDAILLYNFITVDHTIKTIVEEYLKTTSVYNTIHFVIDRSLTKKARKHFNAYCEDKISFLTQGKKFYYDINTKIEHENSESEACLQIADYVASAVFSKFERKNSQYYDIIKNKIKHKSKWDWTSKVMW